VRKRVPKWPNSGKSPVRHPVRTSMDSANQLAGWLAEACDDRKAGIFLPDPGERGVVTAMVRDLPLRPLVFVCGRLPARSKTVSGA